MVWHRGLAAQGTAYFGTYGLAPGACWAQTHPVGLETQWDQVHPGSPVVYPRLGSDILYKSKNWLHMNIIAGMAKGHSQHGTKLFRRPHYFSLVTLVTTNGSTCVDDSKRSCIQNMRNNPFRNMSTWLKPYWSLLDLQRSQSILLQLRGPMECFVCVWAATIARNKHEDEIVTL